MKSLVLAVAILSLACTSCAKVDYAKVLVVEVIDGDTLEIFGGERVRLIGIDTPEMYESDKLIRDCQRTGEDITTIMAMGKEAYKFTRSLVEDKTVRLEFDAERKDDYGRLLAYVFILRDPELFLNAEIVKQGYAQPLTIPPNVQHAALFQKLYQEAGKNKRGLHRGYFIGR